MIFLFLAGGIAGLIHVLSGPDHLAAVAPFALRGRERAWIPGALWGSGHTAGVAVVALAAFALREALPIERLSQYSEQIVGILLILVGAWTVRRALRSHVHTHVHEHDGTRHAHLHVHLGADSHSPAIPSAATGAGDESTAPLPARSQSGQFARSRRKPFAHEHSHAPLWIGIVHGAAGSAHLWALLPALALPSRAEAAAYLSGYGCGTVGAMVGFSATLGLAARVAGDRTPVLYRRFLLTSGLAAIVIGVFWLRPH
ncbi:MAG: nickel transporter [Candidatus Eisenbacteria bacterium]